MNGSSYNQGVQTYGGQAIGIYMLAKMKEPKPGVYAPEGILDTDEFFDLFLELN